MMNMFLPLMVMGMVVGMAGGYDEQHGEGRKPRWDQLGNRFI
jgi:hypothetical protein